MERWFFDVIQDGMVVAAGDCTSREVALAEAGHYVRMYGQDGECQAIVRKPGDRKALAARRRLLAK